MPAHKIHYDRTIIVTKLGMTCRTRDTGHLVTGEQGETEAVVRRLLARQDCHVVYYGTWIGKSPKRLEIVEPIHSLPLDHLSLKKEQKDALDKDNARLGDRDYAGIITVQGISPSWSTIDNPNGAGMQAFAVKRVAPIIHATQQRQLPRVVINNDPRSYPCELEMSRGWPWFRPRALLDQSNRTWKRIVGGVHYKVKAVACYAECWPQHKPVTGVSRTDGRVIIGHAHINTGYNRGESIHTAWKDFLGPIAKLKERGVRIYGTGWEHYCEYDEEVMRGPVNPLEVETLLAENKYGGMLWHTPGFATSKLRAHVEQGCIPLLLGHGVHTYDRDGVYVRLGSRMRMTAPWDFTDTELEPDMSVLKASTTPRWHVFDACMDALLANKLDEEKFGGYVKV